jgi:trehalose 6-phosphate synthase/phosphatase
MDAAVTFTVTAGDTRIGEEVRVVGNIPQLGKWEPERGVALVCDLVCMSEWKTIAPISLPLGTEVEYKYVVINPDGVHWDQIEDNRRLTVSDENITVKDVLNEPRTKIFIHPAVRNSRHNSAHLDADPLWSEIRQEFKIDDPLIIVSMNLPWKIKRAPPGSPSKWICKRFNGLWVPELYDVAVLTDINFTWIGYPSIDLEDPAEQEEVADLLQRNYNCVPLFIPQQTLDLCRQFCNNVLYPLFHNILETSFEHTPVYSEDLWQSYRSVNSLFANKVKENFSTNESNEMIWIHDYQLLLVPGFISHHRPASNIGLFLHIPFPSSEIYKVLKHREELLLSVICCDLIGFHLFEYARHFITACKRILGIDYECIKGGYLGLKFYGRNVLLKVGHLGIETKYLRDTFDQPKYKQTCQEIQTKFSTNFRYALGVDPLHRLSGILNKFKAFANFVSSRHSAKYAHVVLVQLLYRLRNVSSKDSAEFNREVTELAESINATAGRELIVLASYEGMNKECRYAYMTNAFCLVNTSLRDGLNLLPLEYIAVKENRPARIILSEFAGVSRALSSPYRVNPYDLEKLEDAFDQMFFHASEVPSAKQMRDLHFIQRHTTRVWARSFLTDLKNSRKNVSDR